PLLFADTPTTGVYALSLHDALPIYGGKGGQGYDSHRNHLEWSKTELMPPTDAALASLLEDLEDRGMLDETLVVVMGEFGRTPRLDRKSTRLNSSHVKISYAVFCLKK